MSASLDRIEQDIARERADLDAWLADAYSEMEDQLYNGEMDASYHKWATLESMAGSVFDHGLTQGLSESSIDSMLFFISRSDECGRIIAWLDLKVGSPFSWCGKLSYPDFLFLSEQALDRPDDYCDYQLAACYRKCESLDDRGLEILQGFFHKHDTYTRRMVLHAFEHFALPQTIDLATNLWHSVDCEFAKLSCLHALKAFPDARPQFDTYFLEYKETYTVDAVDYRQSHMRQLTSKNAT